MIDQILATWARGGWVMWPLLGVCVLMFWVGVRLWLQLGRMQYRRLEQTQWLNWIRRPDQGEGEVGEIIRYTQDEVGSPRQINLRFAEVTSALLPAIDRGISTLNALVAAAPLVGLLGTVFGMLVTFRALALGGGGGQVTEAMAAGISQALFPPEVGLCIALPGLVLVHLIKRRRQELEAFLSRLESFTIQHFKRSAGLPFVPELHNAAPHPMPVDAALQPA